MIVKQFLIIGMFWVIIGGLMFFVFCFQLGFLEENMVWLKLVLGKWIIVNDVGIGLLVFEFYYVLVMMYGIILVFFVLIVGLSGIFFNLFILLQIGVRDMVFLFMNMFFYWFFFLVGVVMFFFLFLNIGLFVGGWMVYLLLSVLF